MPDDDGRDRTYAELLRVEELLSVTLVHERNVDDMLFMVTHQVCEMWFALILEHLSEARTSLLTNRAVPAAERLERLPAVVRVLVAQFDVLATLDNAAFQGLRAKLGTASGIQSAQFREIEFLCGLRDVRYVNTPGFTEAERARLSAQLEATSVADAFEQLAKRRQDGGAGPLEEVDRVRQAMLDFDESMVIWRSRHASLAERFLGGRTGTAGSAGAAYLWRSTARRLFPNAWPGSGSEDPCDRPDPDNDLDHGLDRKSIEG